MDTHSPVNEPNVNTVTTENNDDMSLKSFIVFATILLVAVFLFRAYVAKPFMVIGTSMYPQFDSSHYLIIDEFTYNFIHDPRRGDVMVFHYPNDESRYFIKRVIGLPGETVQINGTKVTIIKPDGTKLALNEPQIIKEKQKIDHITKHLGQNEYYMLGDNRKESADSRYWGPLNRKEIVGRPIIRLFPFNKIDVLPGLVNYPQ